MEKSEEWEEIVLIGPVFVFLCILPSTQSFRVICKPQMEQRDVVKPLPRSGNEPTYCARVVAAVSLAEREAPM